MVRVVLRLLGIAVLLAVSVLAVTRADVPPYTCVAFVADWSHQMYRLCSNDSTSHGLGSYLIAYRELALSPDGKWLAAVVEGGICCLLARLDVDGTAYQELIRAREMLSVSWSPNGEWIIFHSQPSGFYLIRPDGSDLHLLIDDPALSYARTAKRPFYDFNVAWSPDSEWIALSAVNCSSDLGYTECSSDIYRVRADGSAFQRLTTGLADEFWPVWSPDGQNIAFVSRPFFDEPQEDIFVMRSDGSEVRRLTFSSDESETESFWPIWSPDSQWILFVQGEEHAWWSTLYRVSLTGGEPKKVGEAGLLLSGPPILSPDQNWILSSGVLTDVEGGAYRIRSDGSEVELLFRNPPPGWPPESYQWLPTPAKPWRGAIPLALGGLILALSFLQKPLRPPRSLRWKSQE